MANLPSGRSAQFLIEWVPFPIPRTTSNESYSLISIRFALATWCFIFGVIPLFLSGCSSGELTKDQVLSTLTSRGRRLTVESENYVLQKGDQIEVTVPGYSDFHTTSNVDENGSINIPTIGIIHAGGETKAALREQVKKKLSDVPEGCSGPHHQNQRGNGTKSDCAGIGDNPGQLHHPRSRLTRFRFWPSPVARCRPRICVT